PPLLRDFLDKSPRVLARTPISERLSRRIRTAGGSEQEWLLRVRIPGAVAEFDAGATDGVAETLHAGGDGGRVGLPSRVVLIVVIQVDGLRFEGVHAFRRRGGRSEEHTSELQ